MISTKFEFIWPPGELRRYICNVVCTTLRKVHTYKQINIIAAVRVVSSIIFCRNNKKSLKWTLRVLGSQPWILFQISQERVVVFNATFNNISVTSWHPLSQC